MADLVDIFYNVGHGQLSLIMAEALYLTFRVCVGTLSFKVTIDHLEIMFRAL